MAKRKKIKNIQISNQELTPTTIGYLDNKQKGPFLLLVIFAILFAALYYMPELTEYLNGTKIPNDGNPAGTVYNDSGKIFDINNETLITINNIEFSKILLENNKLSIFVENTKNNTTHLKNYYIELFNKDEKVLERIDLSNESLSNLGKRTFTYDIAHQEETTKISINIISDDNIPKTTLTSNGSMELLTCSNDDIYVYEFSQSFLKNVKVEIEKNKKDYIDESAYQTDLEYYRNIASGTVQEGLSHELITTENGFKFIKKIDLSKVNVEELNNKLFYKFNETSDNVAFQNSLKKYKCY